MDLEKIMKLKVILYTNEIYFFNFKNILLKFGYEIYLNKQHDLLTDRIEKKSKKDLSSKWYYIMRLMFTKTSIPDYSNIKYLENKSNDYISKNIKSYEIDKLQYLYLKKVCITKLKKLNILSIRLKVGLINIIQIYSDLCIKEIMDYRNKHHYNLKEKEYIFKGKNENNNYNKNNSLFNFKIKRKSMKMKTLLFNKIFKNELSRIKNNNNNKKRQQSEDVITNIISQNSNSIDLFSKKNNSSKQKLLYCNSFTRLFIGETDKDSILERHLSNILVLKQNNLNINGSYIDLSEIYLRKIFKNTYKKNSKKLLLDDYLKNTLEKFEYNQKYLDEIHKKEGLNSNSSSRPFTKKYIESENNINKIFLNDKNIVKNKILKSYNFNKNKNENLKGLRKVGSAKIRNKLNLKKKTIKNESSMLIENLCKELSDSKCFSKKQNIKDKKNRLWIKTECNIQQKRRNYYFKNNNTYCGNHFRNNSFKNHKLKKDYKDILSKNDLFFNNKILI